MPGYHRTDPAQRAGHHLTAVACLFLVGLVLAYPARLPAAFIVTTRDGKVETDCYWVQQDSLFLCTGTSYKLHEVVTVDDTRATPDELARQQTAVGEFTAQVQALMEADTRLDVQDSETQELLDYVAGLSEGGLKAKRGKDAYKDAVAALKRLEKTAIKQKDDWNNLKVPQWKLTPLKDLKVLQYMARILSYQEWHRYLDTKDPTQRAYAHEHVRQVGSFEERFQVRLKKLTGPPADPNLGAIPEPAPDKPGTPKDPARP